MAITERYKYRAINSKGRAVRGILTAGGEVDLHNKLQGLGLELIQCAPLNKKQESGGLLAQKVKVRDLIQFFMHMEQMQGAGVPLLDALADIRDTTDHDRLRDMMSEIHRDVYDGSSFSEALARHPKVFTNLYVSLVASGEETGDMISTYRQLIKYLKWVDQMQAKIRKATRYPMIVCGVIFITITVMMTLVVPQIISFVIDTMKQDIPWYTAALVATSGFCVEYWWAILIAPFVVVGSLIGLRKSSDDIAFRLDTWFLQIPTAGELIRKINVARFAQTFGALYASGIDVLYALDAAQKTIGNLALAEALKTVREQVHDGAPLSEAFNNSGEFPGMVIRMLKVGEESGNLTPVLEQVAEFYTNDVDEAIQALIGMIEPMLTAILGFIITWIAAAVFGPIYSTFEKIDI